MRNLRNELDGSRQRLRTAEAGGLELAEEERLSLAALCAELETRLSDTERGLAVTRAALSCLEEEDRIILEGFYMSSCRHRADRLCEKLNYGRTVLYKRRDAALRKFTEALYGCG